MVSKTYLHCVNLMLVVGQNLESMGRPSGHTYEECSWLVQLKLEDLNLDDLNCVGRRQSVRATEHHTFCSLSGLIGC